MKVVKKSKSYWLIVVEASDVVEYIVESLARASFELARPAGMGVLTDFDPSTAWENVKAEALGRDLCYGDPNMLLQMDYVAGRRCKTAVVRGRKYLKVYPGDDRGAEMETMYLLATKYLLQRQDLLHHIASATASIQ